MNKQHKTFRGLLYLRRVVFPISDTKIFYPFLLKNVDSKVGAFRTKVVEMIIGHCDSVKSRKTIGWNQELPLRKWLREYPSNLSRINNYWRGWAKYRYLSVASRWIIWRMPKEIIQLSLRSKRFRGVWEQRKTEERDFRCFSRAKNGARD